MPAAIRAIQVPGRGFEKQYGALRKLMDAAKARKGAPRLRGLTPRTFEAAYQPYHKDSEGA